MKKTKPKSSHFGVTAGSLVNNKLRNEQFVAVTGFLPPNVCRLLMTRRDKVPVRSGSQITWNCGFGINPRLHFAPFPNATPAYKYDPP